MKIEKVIQWVEKASSYGFFFLASALLTLKLGNSSWGEDKMMFGILLMIPIYFVIGGLIWSFLNRDHIPKKHDTHTIGGASITWIFLIMFATGWIASILPQVIRNIVLANIVVCIMIGVGNYYSLKNIAKELNGGNHRFGKRLIVDLKERPKNQEEFLLAIENYCNKNFKNWFFVERSNPATVEVDGKKMWVELEFYYDNFGNGISTIDFMEIH